MELGLKLSSQKNFDFEGIGTAILETHPEDFKGMNAKELGKAVAELYPSEFKDFVLPSVEQKVAKAIETYGIPSPTQTPKLKPESFGKAFRRGATDIDIDLLNAREAFNLGDVPDDKNIKAEYSAMIQASEPKNAAFFNVVNDVSRMLPGMIGGGASSAVLPVAGGLAFWYAQGVGLTYRMMKSEGIDPKIAKPLSIIAGAPYAAIEYSQVGKIVDPAKKAFNDKLVGTAREIMAKLAREYGENWVENVTQEGLQNAVQTGSVEIGRALDEQAEKVPALTALMRTGKAFVDGIVQSGAPMGVLLGVTHGARAATAKYIPRHIDVTAQEEMPPVEQREPIVPPIETEEVKADAEKTGSEAQIGGEEVAPGQGQDGGIRVRDAEQDQEEVSPKITVSSMLFHGTRDNENKPIVYKEQKDFGNVLVVPDNQGDIIDSLSKQGVDVSKAFTAGRIDFNKADKIIREQFKGKYDAIKYENSSRPQVGNEYHELGTNKFYAENEETAKAYSLQTRKAVKEKGVSVTADSEGNELSPEDIAAKNESMSLLLSDVYSWVSPETIMTETGIGGKEEFSRSKSARPSWAHIADQYYTKKDVEKILRKHYEMLTPKQKYFVDSVIDQNKTQERISRERQQIILEHIPDEETAVEFMLWPEDLNYPLTEDLRISGKEIHDAIREAFPRVYEQNKPKVTRTDIKDDGEAETERLELKQATDEAIAEEDRKREQKRKMAEAEKKAEEKHTYQPEAKSKLFDTTQEGQTYELFNMGDTFADTGGYAKIDRYTKPPEKHYRYEPKIKRFFLKAPEMLLLFKQITGGKQPKVVARFRSIFKLGEADIKGQQISLRYDLAKGRIIAQGIGKTLAEALESLNAKLKEAGMELPEKRLIDYQFINTKNFRGYVYRAYDGDTEFWLKTLAHEIGHIVDYIDKAKIKGNVFAHIANLKEYMKSLLMAHPKAPFDILTDKDRSRLRREAEKFLKEQAGKEVTEKILRDVYEGINVKDIIDIWNSVEVDKTTPLYAYIARLDGRAKAEILKQALKGLVAEELRALGSVKIGEEEVEVTRRVSREVSREQASKKYRELLREEILKRGLYEIEVVRDELKKLTQVWKPFNDEKNAGYTKYRYSPEELYADAFSVLLNDPELLMGTAPTFYRAFEAYLQSRPAVEESYNAITDTIDHEDKTTFGLQSQQIRDAAIAGDKKELEILRKTKKVKMRTLLESWFVTKYAKWLEYMRVLKKAGRKDNNVENLLNEINYTSSVARGYMDLIFPYIQGIELDVHEYLFARRAATERYYMMNPVVGSAESAEAYFEWVKNTLRDKGALEKVEAAVAQIEKTRKEFVFPKLKESGMLSDDMMSTIEGNDNYAKFKVIEYLEKSGISDGSASLHHQLGTLKDVANVLTETLMQDIVLMRSADVVMAKKALVHALNNNKDLFDGAIYPAETVNVNGKETILDPGNAHRANYPKDFNPRDYALLTFSQKGNRVGYYVDTELAKMFKTDTQLMNQITHALMFTSSLPKELIINKNLGFMLWNFHKDMSTAYTLLPGLNPLKIFSATFKAIPDTYKLTFKDQLTEDVQYMLENKILTVFRNYNALTQEDDLSLIEKITKSYGGDVGATEKILSAILSPLRFLDHLGNFIEKLTKIMAFKYLKTAGYDMSSKEIAEKIRSQIGSPDFLAKGYYTKILSQILWFSNPSIQGIKAQQVFIGRGYKQANKREFWTKFAIMTAVPLLIQMGQQLGYYDSPDDPEEEKLSTRMKNIGTFWKANFNIIVVPKALLAMIGKEEAPGQTYFIPIPVAWPHLLLRNIAWNIFESTQKDMLEKGWINMLVDQTPLQQVSPIIGVAFNLFQAGMGQNPYDIRMAKNIVPDLEWESGEFKRIFPYLFEDSWNKLGFKLLSQSPIRGYESKHQEFPYSIPYFGNVLKRIVRVDDSGVFERAKRGIAETEKEKSSISLSIRDEIDERIKAIKTDVSVVELRHNLIGIARDIYKENVRDGDINPKEQSFKEFFLKVADRVLKKHSSTLSKVLSMARTREERKAILESLPQFEKMLREIYSEERKIKLQRQERKY